MPLTIAAIPFIWIVPLALYLLTFILVFARWPVPWVGHGIGDPKMTPHKVCLFLQPIGFAIVLWVYMTGGYSQPLMAMAVCWGSFFLVALVCHGELAADRPPARFLTEFYLCMSIGGVLGGIFNNLVAPVIFKSIIEYSLMLVLVLFLRPQTHFWAWIRRKRQPTRIYSDGVSAAGVVVAVYRLSLELVKKLPTATLVARGTGYEVPSKKSAW